MYNILHKHKVHMHVHMCVYVWCTYFTVHLLNCALNSGQGELYIHYDKGGCTSPLSCYTRSALDLKCLWAFVRLHVNTNKNRCAHKHAYMYLHVTMCASRLTLCTNLPPFVRGHIACPLYCILPAVAGWAVDIESQML